MGETALTREIMLAAPLHGCRLFRNNVGMAVDQYGQHIRYGLAVGSSDLIGWANVDGVAVFLAVECKAPGKQPTKEQRTFLYAVRAAGGIGILATSVADFIEGLDGHEAVSRSGQRLHGRDRG